MYLPAMIRKIHLAHCLKEGNWEAVRKDMNLRPVEGVNGDSPKEEILAILQKVRNQRNGSDSLGYRYSASRVSLERGNG